jgi:peptidoglycan/LPS O-acetylase OafA/YrhL
MNNLAEYSQTGRTGAIQYKPELDGIRAIAIIFVLFCHFNIPLFKSGFIGVDVFFVLSGYLITKILFKSTDIPTVVIVEFYKRRVIRLFPALFAMILLCGLVAFVVLDNIKFHQYISSIPSTLLFFSNFEFYFEMQQDVVRDHLKPLLHTWSLGVEEQFYIVWPLFVLSLREHRVRVLALLGLVAILSLSSAVVVGLQNIDVAFYLTPFRAWEFSLGAIAAFASDAASASKRKWLSYCGLAIMTVAMAGIKPILAIPMACVATGLLILGGPENLVGRALSSTVPVFVGRISYSLYIWHWPLIVFAETKGFVGPAKNILGILLSFALAILSWWFLELPIRRRSEELTAGFTFTASAIAIVGAVAVCILLA